MSFEFQTLQSHSTSNSFIQKSTIPESTCKLHRFDVRFHLEEDVFLGRLQFILKTYPVKCL